MRQNTSPKGARGIGIVRTILLIPLLLVVALIAWIVFAEARKSYWDGNVREMCAKDGGVTVYERVPLTLVDLERLGAINGIVPVPNDDADTKHRQYISRMSEFQLHESSPKVTRREFKIIRRTDEKVLGKLVIYSRVGSDFLAIDHESNFSCQDLGMKLNVEEQIFFLKGESK